MYVACQRIISIRLGDHIPARRFSRNGYFLALIKGADDIFTAFRARSLAYVHIILRIIRAGCIKFAFLLLLFAFGKIRIGFHRLRFRNRLRYVFCSRLRKHRSLFYGLHLCFRYSFRNCFALRDDLNLLLCPGLCRRGRFGAGCSLAGPLAAACQYERRQCSCQSYFHYFLFHYNNLRYEQLLCEILLSLLQNSGKNFFIY